MRKGNATIFQLEQWKTNCTKNVTKYQTTFETARNPMANQNHGNCEISKNLMMDLDDFTLNMRYKHEIKILSKLQIYI